ncbi:uncharacterized protein [Erythrolamprus reginae]|uniref:uncharacterized protein isoform X2 n=1 Tax=Erythrolamprus reginae TaxID=121349 RepID=UPI00396CF252
MKYLLFFTALIATATAADLVCDCVSPTTGPACKDNTCSIAKGQCYSMAMQYVVGNNNRFDGTSKGCQEDKDPNVCNEKDALILTEDVFYILGNAECCNSTASCNKALAPKVPDFAKVNKTLSKENLVCPSCYVLGQKTCETVDMKCREGQNKCFSVTGTLAQGGGKAVPFVAKGCASPSVLLKTGPLVFGPDAFNIESVDTSGRHRPDF